METKAQWLKIICEDMIEPKFCKAFKHFIEETYKYVKCLQNIFSW